MQKQRALLRSIHFLCLCLCFCLSVSVCIALWRSCNDHYPTALAGKGSEMAAREAAMPRRWVADERDSFIAWLRGEFAAANAIIDAICAHLQNISKAREYDHVLHCVQQRRFPWTPVLHLQQYYSVAEVVTALQQVAMNKQGEDIFSNSLVYKQQRRGSEGRSSGKALQYGAAFHREHRQFLPVDSGKIELAQTADSGIRSRKAVSESVMAEGWKKGGERREAKKPPSDGSTARNPSTEAKFRQTNASRRSSENGSLSLGDKPPEEEVRKNCSKDDTQFMEKTERQSVLSAAHEEGTSGDEVHKTSNDDDAQKLALLKISKNLSYFVEIESQMVNILEGLELHENVVDKLEAAKLISLSSKSQLIAKTGMHREEATDRVPAALESFIDRLISLNICPPNKRPDSCIFETLDEGIRMLPSHNHNFEEPFCILPLLSDCFLSISAPVSIKIKEAFTLCLPIGSVLVLQGKSVDLSKYASCTLAPKQTFLTLGKMLAKPSNAKPMERENSVSTVTPVDLGNEKSLETPTRLLTRQHSFPGKGTIFKGTNASLKVKSMSLLPGVLPSPGVRSPGQLHHTISTPGVPPAFPTTNVNAGAYSTVALMPPGWSTVPGGRVPSAGTGVFLPSLGNCSNLVQPTNETPRHEENVTSVPSLQNENHSTGPGFLQNGSAAESADIEPSNLSMPIQVLDEDVPQLTELNEVNQGSTDT